MYDTYFPVKPERCPRCRRKLENWQGKDGPCSLLAWKQGLKHPIGFFPCDSEKVEPFATGKQNPDTLPPIFRISTSCAKHWIEAKGSAPNGVWTETIVTRVVKGETRRRERMRELKPWLDMVRQSKPAKRSTRNEGAIQAGLETHYADPARMA